MPAESGIYKIDGVRIIAASSQRAAMDSEGDTISSTYLKKADLTTASGIWEDASSAVSANSGTWNDVTAKVDTATYNAYTATADVTEYTAGANIDITSHVISGKNWTTDIQGASANAVTTVEGKFGFDTDNEITGYNGSAFAGEEYTAGDGIDITNNEISVTGNYVTSAGAGLTGNLVLNNNQWVEMPEMGGYTTAAAGADLHPDVQSPSHKLIYLVQDTTATGPDTYKEWIYSSEDAWVLIGDTTLDLTNYATTAWVDSDYVATATTGTWDVVAYTAGANIDITSHTISGKDWSTDITTTAQAASANAVTTVEGKFGLTTGGEISSYNNSAIAHPDLSDFVTSSELETALEDYQTTADMTAYLQSATYAAASGNWENTYNTVYANSGSWTHTFTVVEVPNLANIPNITNP